MVWIIKVYIHIIDVGLDQVDKWSPGGTVFSGREILLY
jgi:hypothetical protein